MHSIYRVTLRSVGLMLKLVLTLIIPIEIAGVFGLSPILSPINLKLFYNISPLEFYLLFSLGLFIFTMVTIIIIYKSGTFLRISSEGVEYHRWPFATIKCRWDETEKISQGRAMGLSFSTLMITRDRPGRVIPVGLGTLGSANHKLVPLNEFQGWPDGGLKNEMMQYAPHLFRAD